MGTQTPLSQQGRRYCHNGAGKQPAEAAAMTVLRNQMGANSRNHVLHIRRAEPKDAADICSVVRSSILELCFEDHHDDELILSRWLENKTTEHVLCWIANPSNINFVAVRKEVILAAGCVTIAGEVILNYVSPTARFQGVSSALLAEMEAATRSAGGDACVLNSTTTAHSFNQRRGYTERASPVLKFGLTTWPMIKRLR